MAVIDTGFLALHTWEEGENPGAGSQTVKGGGGLNDNWLIINDWAEVDHESDGTHSAQIIGISQFKAEVADESTIELHVTNGLQLKDGGITGAKLAAGIVDDSTIAIVGNQLIVKDLGVTGGSFNQTGGSAVVDETTLEFSGNKMQVKDDSITPAKQPHDNARTKHSYPFALTAITTGTYGQFGGVACTANMGLRMSRPGSVTRVEVSSSDGGVNEKTIAYGVSTFVAGDKLQPYAQDIATTENLDIRKNNGAFITSASDLEISGTAVIGTLEVEFDD